MAEPQTPERRDSAEAKLFTLSEVSQRTGISMPTLQRYKKTYQDRIPSVGTGRKQRYPEHSLPVFEELRTENAGKRGRPRKGASAAAAAGSTAAGRAKRGTTRRTAGVRGTGRKPGRPAAAARPVAAAPARRGRPPGRPKSKPAARRGAALAARPTRGVRGGARGRAAGATGAAGSKRSSGLLTLTEISKTTGISYPTLVRYVRLYSDRLKHEGKGRARRFFPEAVEAFRTLRQESSRGGRGRAGARRGSTGARRGRPPKAASAAAATTTERLEAILRKRLRELEKLQEGVQKRFSDLVKGLQKLL
jgi:predicted DNA-binding transcriptional regulator AlpA